MKVYNILSHTFIQRSIGVRVHKIKYIINIYSWHGERKKNVTLYPIEKIVAAWSVVKRYTHGHHMTLETDLKVTTLNELRRYKSTKSCCHV